MKAYVSRNRAVLFVLNSAFIYTFLYFPFMGWSLYAFSTGACMLLVIWYVMTNLDAVLRMHRYSFMNGLACLYFFSSFLSRLLNGERSPLLFLFFLFRCAMFPFIELQRKKKHLFFFYKVLLLWYGISLFFNDVLMVLLPGGFYGDGLSKNFLLGNKFNVAYDHMVFLIVFCMLYTAFKKNSGAVAALFLLTCIICYYINCRTSLIGMAVLLLVFMAPKKILDRLGTSRVIQGIMVFCALFIFFTRIVHIPALRYLITEVLGRDITLTGRLPIYDILPRIIRKRPWLGYGDSAGIISQYTGAYDAQNGFFELVVSNGYPSAILYVLLVSRLVRKPDARYARFLLGGMYAFIIMSMVEVTYETTLLLFGILLFTDSAAYQDEMVRLAEADTVLEWRLM